jgi:hypothetical protein
MAEHVNIDRAWFLIQERSSISLEEAAHLDCCEECRKFLANFVSVVRFVGFSVRFPTGVEAHVDGERAA